MHSIRRLGWVVLVGATAAVSRNAAVPLTDAADQPHQAPLQRMPRAHVIASRVATALVARGVRLLAQAAPATPTGVRKAPPVLVKSRVRHFFFFFPPPPLVREPPPEVRPPGLYRGAVPGM